MIKPQKKKYRVFARDFDRKPTIEEYDDLENVEQYMEEKKWITITIEQKMTGAKE